MQNAGEYGLLGLIVALSTTLGGVLTKWFDARQTAKTAAQAAVIASRETTIHERQQDQAEADGTHKRYLDLQIAFDKHIEVCAKERTRGHEVEQELRDSLAECRLEHAKANAALETMGRAVGLLREQVRSLEALLKDGDRRAMLASVAHIETIQDAAALIEERDQAAKEPNL